jgi:ATP-dependent DNA helicase RecG
MKKYKIFISSVQKEFAAERAMLSKYIKTDALLKDYFEPFLFEEVPANTLSPQNVYLKEVSQADIYIGILGLDYGYEDTDGISPTEHEYNSAKENNITRWIYLNGTGDSKRHPKEKAFIGKVSDDVSWKRFTDMDSLIKEVYNSCIRFLKQNGKIETRDFDESINSTATINDIDAEKIKKFVLLARYKRNFPLRETATTEQVLNHLNLMRNGELVNSALLAFGTNPQSFFPTATVKCAHFHGFHIQKPIPYYREFGGTVFQMAEEAVDFVLSKLDLSVGTREFSNQVPTNYEIPRQIVAEAIINAVAHRDYLSKGSIQVSIFKDRIEISNPGTLPDELVLSDLKLPHGSYPHNPLLAGCLFLTGDIERYGTGTLEIYQLAKEKGLILPSFSLDGGFKVTLWRPSALANPENTYHKILETDHDADYVTDHDTDYDTDYVTDHDTDQEKVEITELMRRLVMVLKEEKSRQEIMDKLDLRHIPSFRELYLQPCLDAGLIEMTQPNKPKSKTQNYRLTKKGLELKKKKK